MTSHSGKFGVVNGQSTVRNWNINELQDAKAFVATNTKCGTARTPGVYDWNGSFSQYGGAPSVLPGESLTFGGYTAPDTDVEGADGQRYSGTAIVDSVTITWNWSSGEIVSSVVNFSGNGALTKDTGVYTDATSLVIPSFVNTKVERHNGTIFVEWTDVEQVTFTITAANQEYVSSSSIVSGKAWKMRKAGVIDFSLAIVEQKTLRASLPDIADNEWLKLHVDGSTFWELKWAHFKDFSGISVDRESGAILKRTANLAMQGFNPTVGYIKRPDTTVYWGV